MLYSDCILTGQKLLQKASYKSSQQEAHCIRIVLVSAGKRKFNFYFRGLLFTSHWLTLQHWTGFYIEIARSPRIFFPLTPNMVAKNILQTQLEMLCGIFKQSQHFQWSTDVGFGLCEIHWASKEGTLTKTESIKMNHIWTQIRYSTPY